MDDKFYLTDIESGEKYEVTKEQYNSYIRMWNLFAPKITNVKCTPILYGTSGDINTNEFYKLWQTSLKK